MRPGPPVGTVTGYRLILPRPWIRLPIREGAEAAIAELVERRVVASGTKLPPDQVGPLRRQLRRRLQTQVDAARQVGGIEMFLPDADMHGLLVGASFVTSEVSPPGDSSVPGSEILVLHDLALDGDGEEFEIDGCRWVRRSAVDEPDATRNAEIDVATTRVTYTAPRPGDPSRWMLVAFSCVGDGDPDSEATAAIVLLFDAIMSSWVWARVGDAYSTAASQ